MAHFYLKKGDLNPALRVTIKDADGNAINLTSTTWIVRGRMRGATSLAVNGVAAVLVDAANGILEHRWSGSETATEGLMLVEFRRTDSGQQTAPSNGHLEVQIGPNV